ncbi:nitrate- and nitrite sensing domain-containing protein [Streptomyces sp. NPDC006654]|uniref:nitrate- and nitrite sensing domain-containing protein n=1 Tax=Streptomyces sp. NPDC006654 TaxID=3156897 RepID=UPI0033CD91F9
MRLADLQVRHRITVLAVLPLTAAMLLTAPLVAERVQAAQESAWSAKDLRLAGQVGGLVAALQRERLYSSAYLALPGSDSAPLVRQASRTDAEMSDLRRNWLGPHAPVTLVVAFREAADLDRTRRQVLTRAVTPRDVSTRYGAAISALLDALPASATAPGSDRGPFGGQHAVVEELLRTHESSSAFGALLLNVVSDPAEAWPSMGEVESLAATAEAEKRRFLQDASASESDLFRKADFGDEAAKVESYADALTLWAYTGQSGTVRGGDLPDGVTVARVFEACDSLDQHRVLVQNKIARDSAAAASDNASDARGSALAFILAVLAFAITMVWLTVRIARSIANPLRLLPSAAEHVAHVAEDELTRVVEDAAGPSSGRPPVRLMRVPNVTKDELGQLAVAFNRVQDAAVVLMERQARSRDNAAAMLGHVGRRTQNLAALQLSMIDSMERAETDPAVLEHPALPHHPRTHTRRE